MMRGLLLVGLLLGSAATLIAQDSKLTGSWRFSFQANEPVTVLLRVAVKDGKPSVEVLETNPALQGPMKAPLKLTVDNAKITGDALSLTLYAGTNEVLTLDGLLAKDGKKILASIGGVAAKLGLIELTRTNLKSIADDAELAREEFASLDGGPALFNAGVSLLEKAGEKKLSATEVRSILDKLGKAAAAYGPRWEFANALKLTAVLAAQDGLAELALGQAQRTERLLGDDAPTAKSLEVLRLKLTALQKCKKDDEAKDLEKTVAKLEARDVLDFAKQFVPFDTPAFPGRKAKSDRAVLVEHFTSSEDEGCFAAASAVEGVLRTYKPGEAVVLQYHVPVGGPDPLICREGVTRQFLMFNQIAAPLVMVNGKPLSRTGAGTGDAKDRYKQLCDLINEQVELPPTVKLTLAVAKEGKAFKATANITGLEKPGEKVTLRFAVVEPRVTYTGASGVRLHTNVVRGLPGGAKGYALTKKDTEQSVMIDADELRADLTKFLDEFAKEQGEFPRGSRLQKLADLRLIAFVQNDENREVLQAIEVDLAVK